MKKYLIIGLAAFILETASERSMSMIFWASMGPFLGLPFVGYMVESKTWTERIKMAVASAIGYALGATIVYIMNN